jgi:hypothetical protein
VLAAREKEGHWRKGCVAFTVARSPTMNGHTKASYCDVVEHLGTWHPIGRRPTPVNLSGPAVRQGGGVQRPTLGLIRDEDLFTLKRYPTTNGTNRIARANPGAGVASVKVHCTNDLLQLLYNQNTIESV